jgi:hypothetical protein
MNLYDLMGPIAIGAGAGIAYATAGHQTWTSIAGSFLLGVISGAAMFIKIREAVYGSKAAKELTLAALYVGTFIGSGATSYLVALGSLAVARRLGI